MPCSKRHVKPTFLAREPSIMMVLMAVMVCQLVLSAITKGEAGMGRAFKASRDSVILTEYEQCQQKQERD